jgi:Putative sensor
MNTTTITRGSTPPHSASTDSPSQLRRIFGVVAKPQSYRNIGYLILGLPLGTIWFSILVTAWSVGVSLLVVALLGVPVLLATWYVTRWFANVERITANELLEQQLVPVSMAAPRRGNLWVRLRSMSRERDRWRELGYLMMRFPFGIATFTAAVPALAVPFAVAYAPFAARNGDRHPFGTWSESSRIEDVASSPWSWFLIPLGIAMLVGAFHLINALARACGRWTTAWLGASTSTATS